jgi:hypothetical protein
VRNDEVLHRIKEERNILHTIKRRKANWIGHILRKNCLIKHAIEGKIKEGIKVKRRQGGKRKQLLDDFKEKRGYCKLNEETLAHTLWRSRFGRVSSDRLQNQMAVSCSREISDRPDRKTLIFYHTTDTLYGANADAENVKAGVSYIFVVTSDFKWLIFK